MRVFAGQTLCSAPFPLPHLLLLLLPLPAHTVQPLDSPVIVDRLADLTNPPQALIGANLTSTSTSPFITGRNLLGQESEPDPSIIISRANLTEMYEDRVDSNREFMFKYNISTNQIGNGSIRIYVESEDSIQDSPVLVVVRHQKGVLSWQLPLLIQENVKSGSRVSSVVSQYRSVNRTLCPLSNYEGTKHTNLKHTFSHGSASAQVGGEGGGGKKGGEEEEFQSIAISISTSSALSTGFKLQVYIEDNFQLRVDEPRTIEVSPSAPQYFQFNFPDEFDFALIHVESPDSFCMILSVQNISCPISDMDKNVAFEGSRQTMDKKSGMTIRKDQFPAGLHVVFVVQPDDLECAEASVLWNNTCHGPCRKKTVNFKITRKITKEEYIIATFGAFGMFVGAYVVVILVSCLLCVRTMRSPQERSLFDQSLPPPNTTATGPVRSGYESFDSMSTTTDSSGNSPLHTVPRTRPPTSRVPQGSRARVEAVIESQTVITSANRSLGNIAALQAAAKTADTVADNGDRIETLSEDSSLDETDIDMLVDADLDKDVFRTKTFLFVSDLARKPPGVLSKKSMMYHWNLLTIAIFYGLPVIQLVVTYQTVLNETGNEDLCYYNFLCSHPLGLLSDFNHVYSNIGYVMLGGLFMVFTWRREIIYRRLLRDNPRLSHLYGIPQHPGLFYAMGLALVMEGLMSGCYHICPNHSNFQFDTAFMYTIAILCMLKLYQFRHPDINANAYTAFGVLAFVIFLGVLGVFNGSVFFWVFFTGCHVVTCIILSSQIYYMGRWKVNGGLVKRIWQLCAHDVAAMFTGNWYALRPTYPDRILLLLIFNMANWGLSIYGILVLAPENGDFASFLLAVFIGNLMLYVSFYILMKLRHGERLCWQAITYMFLATLCCIPAMWFFLNKSTTWNLKPAESRQYNQECVLFHFYDNHDIWHFLSSAFLFFSFMLLLTLDDDLAEKPRDKIPVF